MLPNDSTSARQPRRGAASRYVISVVLLVAIIGGVAWVVQYLPNMMRGKGGPNPNRDKPLLAIMPKAAIWRSPNPLQKKDADPATKEIDEPKEFEQGQAGHYDFLFKNVSGADLDVLHYTSSCNCANVKASVLTADEHERVSKHFAAKPGEPLPYAKEPDWHELSKDPANAKSLTVKADEMGVIRVGWVARTTGALRVSPNIACRPSGAVTLPTYVMLSVPIVVQHAVQFHPARLHVGVLIPGAESKGELKGELDAWSSTRDSLDLKLATLNPDPFFDIATRPLSKKECADLEETLKSKKIDTTVRSAVRVIVKVNEKSKDGRQLELGSFHRPLLVHLKGPDGYEPRQDIKGPEIVGRVDGDIVINSVDKKISFPSFTKSTGSSLTIELTAPADLKLAPFKQEPHWLELKLTPDEMTTTSKRRTWNLRVTVPADTPTVRSLADPDAVVLRIIGPPERFVRIALITTAWIVWDMPFVAPPDQFVRIPVEGHATR